MIALDSNILIRLLTEDDDSQYDRILAMLDALDFGGEEIVITDVALCETAWVLKRGYKASKKEISKALEELVNIRGFRMANQGTYERALGAYERGNADFADYLLREQAREAGCRAVATFDKTLLKDEGFFKP